MAGSTPENDRRAHEGCVVEESWQSFCSWRLAGEGGVARIKTRWTLCLAGQLDEETVGGLESVSQEHELSGTQGPRTWGQAAFLRSSTISRFFLYCGPVLPSRLYGCQCQGRSRVCWSFVRTTIAVVAGTVPRKTGGRAGRVMAEGREETAGFLAAPSLSLDFWPFEASPRTRDEGEGG